MGKGENAGYQHFLLFHTMFSISTPHTRTQNRDKRTRINISFKSEWSSANAISLWHAKTLRKKKKSLIANETMDHKDTLNPLYPKKHVRKTLLTHISRDKAKRQ